MIKLSNINSNNLHHFAHEAMATIFEVLIQSENKNYAEQAAQNVFAEIDNLEDKFSRFRSNTDIAKINNSKIEEEIILSFETFECIWIAKNIYEMTNGLFDITTGNIIDKWKNKSEASQSSNGIYSDFGNDKFILNENDYTIRILNDKVSFDLGGIGKGYAVDLAAKLLLEWDLENALIHGGGSSVKTIGKLDDKNGWPVTISNPINYEQIIARLNLSNLSLSGSGKQKHNHIINPKTLLPNYNRTAAWVLTESAAISDAVSTAFMLMDKNEILEFCKINDYINAMIILNDKAELKKEDLIISDNFGGAEFFV